VEQCIANVGINPCCRLS